MRRMSNHQCDRSGFQTIICPHGLLYIFQDFFQKWRISRRNRVYYERIAAGSSIFVTALKQKHGNLREIRKLKKIFKKSISIAKLIQQFSCQ